MRKSQKEFNEIRIAQRREKLFNDRLETKMLEYKRRYKKIEAQQNSKSDYEKMQELANKVLEENRVKVEKESKYKELLEWAKMIVKDKEV